MTRRPRTSKKRELLRVFLACPGDTGDEVGTIEKVIKQINDSEGRDARQPYFLELRHWKSHTYSTVGPSPEQAIVEQLDYEIFIGVMAGRFGQPTSTSASGTQEELDRALMRWYRDEVEIGFYFKNMTFYVHDGSLDFHQVCMVREFRDRISTQGVLYHIFDTQEQLGSLVRKQLSENAKKLLSPKRRLVRPRPGSGEKSQTKSLPDWQAVPDHTFPQGVTYRDLEIPTLPFRHLSIYGRFQSSSPYFRFGFKLLTAGARRLVGDGSVESMDNNVVIHIYRDLNSSNMLFTSYASSRRDRGKVSDEVILDYTACEELPILLSLSEDSVASFEVAGKCVYRRPISPEIRNRIYALAWGDGHDFVVFFRNVAVTRW